MNITVFSIEDLGIRKILQTSWLKILNILNCMNYENKVNLIGSCLLTPDKRKKMLG